jgi:hypothetical protein
MEHSAHQVTYRRKTETLLWHFHPECQRWPSAPGSFTEQKEEPQKSIFCTECGVHAYNDKRKIGSAPPLLGTLP